MENLKIGWKQSLVSNLASKILLLVNRQTFRQNLGKIRYQSALGVSNFAWYPYFLQSILSLIVDIAKQWLNIIKTAKISLPQQVADVFEELGFCLGWLDVFSQ